MNKKIINIDDMPMDPRPNLYNISGNYLKLRFPFSSYFIEQIDKHKKLYNKELDLFYKQSKNLDENDNLCLEKIEEFLEKFSENILAMIPSLTPTILQIARNFSDALIAELELAQMCPPIIELISKDNINSNEYEYFGIHLINQVCKMMLKNIIKLKNKNANESIFANDLREWQQQVTNILILSANIKTSSESKALQFLCICNDLISIQLIKISDIVDAINIKHEPDPENKETGLDN
ncbi:26890_t:CDS:2 [Gigaspora margarita]|uniref:26890_t:CDS:1 n=1 Tax=Gigaspora margarita TaxID=4874 RepID=A0ABN7VEC0_GIGMA|nr:26890_t:CDS:2 [Gigaspora margarita]